MTLKTSHLPESGSGESSFLRRYCLNWWPGILAAWICALILGLISSVIASLTGPAMQVLLDSGSGNTMFGVNSLLGDALGHICFVLSGRDSLSRNELLTVLPLGLAGLSSLKALFYTTQGFLWERAGELISKDIRNDLMKGYLHLSPTARKSPEGKKTEADFSSNLTTDIRMTREYFVHFYGGLPRELFQMMMMAAVLMALSMKLFLLFFLCVLPLVAIVGRLGRKLRKRAGKALSDYSTLTEWLQQRLLGLETIKHYRTESVEISRMQSLTTSLNEKFLKAARVKARTSPTVEMVAISAVAGVLIVAFLDIKAGELTGAVAVSFFSTLALLSQSASMVGRYFNSNREGSAATGRLLDLRNFLSKHQKDTLGGDAIETLESTSDDDVVVECRQLSVTYPGQTKAALKGFTRTFKKSTIYCLAGPSGAGKSTLFQALLNLVPVSEGQMIFHRDTEKEVTGYMPQQTLLMSGSIAENIAYPDESWDDGKVIKSLRQTGLYQDVMKLPDAIRHNPLKDGSGLSGGQIQRVLLSRLFYHQFRLILFDEGTSALDPETEQLVFGILTELKNLGACIIMIAHRPSAMSFADEMIYLKKGMITDKSNI